MSTSSNRSSIGGGAAFVAGLLLIASLIAADGQSTQKLWDELWFQTTFVMGVLLAVSGVYLAASAYWPLPMPKTLEERQANPKQKESAAHKVAKQLLKEDGLWPPWWKFWARGGLTWSQYEALRAREIAEQHANAASIPSAAPSIPPMSTQELAQKVARVAEQAKGGQQLKTVDDLLRRGGTLRVKTTSVTEPDAYARRYRHAGIAGAQDAIAKALATTFAPVEVNLWLESVARFVDANFSEYSDRIVPRALTKSEPQVIIDAIDQNFAVLRLIKAGLET